MNHDQGVGGFLGIAAGERSGHGALMAVTQMFRSKMVAPGRDWSQISTPGLGFPGTVVDCCMGGLPSTTLPRTTLSVADGNTIMPFVLPMAVFSSTRLLLPERIPIPKLLVRFA